MRTVGIEVSVWLQGRGDLILDSGENVTEAGEERVVTNWVHRGQK